MLEKYKNRLNFVCYPEKVADMTEISTSVLSLGGTFSKIVRERDAACPIEQCNFWKCEDGHLIADFTIGRPVDADTGVQQVLTMLRGIARVARLPEQKFYVYVPIEAEFYLAQDLLFSLGYMWRSFLHLGDKIRWASGAPYISTNDDGTMYRFASDLEYVSARPMLRISDLEYMLRQLDGPSLEQIIREHDTTNGIFRLFRPKA